MLRITIHSVLSVMVLAFFTGCPAEDETQTYNEADPNVNGGHGHSHDAEGPHGGHVIEIGEEVAHLEVTMGEDRTITVYVLGADIETPSPVAVTDVIFELEGENDEETELELTPMPLEGEEEGTSSVFVVKAETVPEAIDDIEKLHGHVHITIDGKEYEGELAHDHDEHGHEEDGEDHDEDGDHEDDAEEDADDETDDDAEEDTDDETDEDADEDEEKEKADDE